MDHGSRLRAVALVLAMIAGCLALWTVNPIFWLWLASQIDEGGPPSMTAVVVVLLGLVGSGIAIGKLLATLHASYREIRGVRTSVKLRAPWSSSAAAAHGKNRPRDLELTVLDVILISSVLVAAGLYEYWFLFESGSPIDLRTGRE
jgi:hypothetical protein